jgi:hypothetical protein
MDECITSLHESIVCNNGPSTGLSDKMATEMIQYMFSQHGSNPKKRDAVELLIAAFSSASRKIGPLVLNALSKIMYRYAVCIYLNMIALVERLDLATTSFANCSCS